MNGNNNIHRMKMKKRALLLLVFIIGIIIGIILYMIGSKVINSYYTSTAFIRIDSVQCLKGGELFGKITVAIHNSGQIIIPVQDLHLLVDGSSPNFFCSSDFIPGASTVCITNSVYSENHNVEVQGPANTVSSPVTCS
jgi:hypothetical protein